VTKIAVLPLDFLGQGALLEPVDRKLHDLAVNYAMRELAKGKDLNFANFSKVWVGLRDDEVFGVSGYVLKPDVPLLRATDADVLRALCHRMNDFFADNGARGKEAFIYIGDEKPEARCPEWKAVLKEFSAKSAQRWAIEVK
jgi:hypothetical protein